jgi:hypothetical protein
LVASTDWLSPRRDFGGLHRGDWHGPAH